MACQSSPIIHRLFMLQLFSPAKVNLFLRITGQRPDGYHAIASLFQAISLGDLVHLSLSSNEQLTCSDPAIPTDKSNLILKAAELFRQKTGLNCRINAHLEKKIPAQAGLGGGSGNAATTLWGLNILSGANISVKTLQTWSSEIGSDIPFFFSEGTAYCTGRGEVVQNLASLPDQKIVIAKPDIGLSTPAVFSRFRSLGLIKRETTPEEDLQHFINGNAFLYNDLEPAAFHELPMLAAFKEKLFECGFHDVLMTGSGTAFVCFGKAKNDVSKENISFNAFYEKAAFINRPANAWYTACGFQ